jgi:hypothetical protein
MLENMSLDARDHQPMNVRELEQRLLEEGCNPGMYAVGTRGGASDAHCLIHNGKEWQVYYTERGVDQAPLFSTPNEEEACEHFFAFMMKFRHDHCVGTFVSESTADELYDKLLQHRLKPFRDLIPTPVVPQPIHRVWVSGKEIFAVEKIIGTRFVTDRPQKTR